MIIAADLPRISKRYAVVNSATRNATMEERD